MRYLTSRLALTALLSLPLVNCVAGEEWVPVEPERELLEDELDDSGSGGEGGGESGGQEGDTRLGSVAPAVNSSPDYLVVYNNNIENQLPVSCGSGDWNKFFNYLKAQPQSPDIFITQQISNAAQLTALTTRMTDELPGTYAGVIAIANPGSMGYTSTCGRLKNQQTNAVIFRTDRFTHEASTRWRSDAPDDWAKGTGGCRNLDDTPNSQDRVHNVAIRLFDRISKRTVTAASIHWPTGTWNGPDCAAENMREAAAAVEKLGGTLKIVAGDANTSKGTAGWWNNAIGLGFRDPIAETCPAAGCPDSTSTLGKRRIDYILVKGGNGFKGATTISKATVGGTYSDHLALRANLHY